MIVCVCVFVCVYVYVTKMNDNLEEEATLNRRSGDVVHSRGRQA